MLLTDLGFIFLLLPIAAVIYYALPLRHRATVLLCFSVMCYLWMEPLAGWLLLSVGADTLVAHLRSQNKLSPIWYRLCCGKNILVLVIIGCLLPLCGVRERILGSVVLPLCAIEGMTAIERGKAVYRSPVLFAANLLFFGRLLYGPVGYADRLQGELVSPRLSLSRLGEGALRIIVGIAKRIVLAEQLFSLVKTYAHLPMEEYSILLIWMAAASVCLGIYFTLSAYSDIAVGLAEIFSLTLPRMTYFPLQANTVREYLYRLHLSLEDTLYTLMLPSHHREQSDRAVQVFSLLLPFVLGLWIMPEWGMLAWSAQLVLFSGIDTLLHRTRWHRLRLLPRLFVFVGTLPAYLWLLPLGWEERGRLVLGALGLGGFPFLHSTALYLLTGHLMLFCIALLAAISAGERLGRLVQQQFSALWWVAAVLWNGCLLAVTASFMLWNVR